LVLLLFLGEGGWGGEAVAEVEAAAAAEEEGRLHPGLCLPSSAAVPV